MSRFDDELRHAASGLAREPLPGDLLDEALDVSSGGMRSPSIPAAVVAVVVVAVAAGIGMASLVGEPRPVVSPSPAPTTTTSVTVGCPETPAPETGADVVLISFPCGDALELASAGRSVRADLATSARIDAALQELLMGPTPSEEASGLMPVVPHGSDELVIGVITDPNGLAQIDFSSALREVGNLSTTTAGERFIVSVRETVLGFDEITAVELRIDDSCDAFFAHFGGACQQFAEPLDWELDCPVVSPTELPSSAPITPPRVYPGQTRVSWGSDADTVSEQVVYGDTFAPDAQPDAEITFRGRQAFVIAGEGSDPPRATIQWTEDGCGYALSMLLTVPEAIDYAASLDATAGTVPPPDASAPPAEPVTNSFEQDGMRITLTLDRDRTSHGGRVWADVSVENTGADIVHWGHSGTCDFAASVSVEPVVDAPMPYGRDDWSGDLATLKHLSAGDAERQTYGFEPAEWIDFVGTWGCTTDMVIDEMAPDEVLTHRAGWDANGPGGMPAVPGMYHVTASFFYLTRGAPPAVDEEIESSIVSVEVTLAVDGPEVAWVSPGEAMDAILGDASFQARLNDAPLGRWVSHDLLFEDGRWVLTLYLSETNRDVDIVEAIVATVDATSGDVVNVALVPGAQPPGG